MHATEGREPARAGLTGNFVRPLPQACYQFIAPSGGAESFRDAADIGPNVGETVRFE